MANADYLKHKAGSLEDVVANQSSQKFKEDSGYQKMFNKELDKAGKNIGGMSPGEKKSFFNKIDSKYTAKKEGLDTMVPNKKDDKEDLKRKKTMTGEKPTKVDMEPEVKMDTQKPYSGKTNK